MLRDILFILFFTTIGNAFSQLSFFVNLNLDYKINYGETYLGSQLLGANTRLEHLHIYAPRANRVMPMSLGIGFGLNYNRHRLYFNFQNAYASSIHYVYLKLADDGTGLDAYAPTLSSTTAPNRRFSILYDFYILKKEKKTNLYVTAGLDVIYRAGPRGVGPAGAMYMSGKLGDNYYYSKASESFTADKNNTLGYTFGVGTDIYIKGYYILSASCKFMYANGSLTFTNERYKFFDNGTVTTYNFTVLHKSTSFLFGISRRFQIFPWKPLKSNPIVKFIKGDTQKEKKSIDID